MDMKGSIFCVPSWSHLTNEHACGLILPRFDCYKAIITTHRSLSRYLIHPDPGDNIATFLETTARQKLGIYYYAVKPTNVGKLTDSEAFET